MYGWSDNKEDIKQSNNRNCPEISEVECEKSETKTDTSEMTEVKWDITENEMQLKTDTSEMTEVKWDTTE